MINWIKNLFDFGRTFGAARSPEWGEVRKEFLKEHPECAVCGRKASFLRPLNVHHKKPFNKFPEEELNKNNLITLCPDHHLFVGHLMNFKSFNVDVKTDAETWRLKIKNRP